MRDNKKQNKERKFAKEHFLENNDINKEKFESINNVSKSKILSKLLNLFSKNELNKYFDRMSSDLINYRIAQEDTDVTMLNKKSFKNVLFDSLEKNLIEIIYINEPKYREERISKIYNWYTRQIKKFEDERYINKKSYKDPNSFDDEDYVKEKFGKMLKEREYLTEDKILKEQMKHRSKEIFDKKMLREYKRVQVYNNPYYKKVNYQKKKQFKEKEESIKPLTSSPLKTKLSPPFPINNTPFGYLSNFYSNLNRTNSFCLRKISDNKSIEKPEGGEKEKTFYSRINNKKKFISPELYKEIKASYSFNRPPIDFNILSGEKEIIENKNKLIQEKRYNEEINKNVEKFGFDRAKFKENILKKYEIKKIINMYTKTKKLNTKLLKKYIKQKSNNILNSKNETFSNSNNNFISNISANNISIKENLESNVFNIDIKRHNSIKQNIKYISKSPPKGKKENDNQKILRKLKRHYTFGEMKISKKFRRMGKKLILEEVKNIDKQTNEIIDQTKDKIYFYDLKLKYPKESLKQNLLLTKINSENEKTQTPCDITYNLISTQPLFRQKILSDNLCSITSKINDERFQRKVSEEEPIYHNFCLSAYHPKNLKIIDKNNKPKFQKGIKIFKHISPCTSKIGKKKLLDENDSFDNYKNNYLSLRKTIGEWKKYEYEQLMDKINKENIREGLDDDSIGLSIEKISKNNNDAFYYKISSIKYKKEKNLMNAIMNPEENNSFPTYYLPKTERSFRARIENYIPKKKK